MRKNVIISKLKNKTFRNISTNREGIEIDAHHSILQNVSQHKIQNLNNFGHG